MIKYEFKINGITCVRVSKALARKAYNYGLRVYFCPCKLRPGFPWNPEIAIAKQDGDSFETVLNAFEFHNCNLNAVGRYTAFYMEKWNMIHFQFSNGSNPYIFKSSRPETRIKVLETWSKNYFITIDSERDGFVSCTLRRR